MFKYEFWWTLGNKLRWAFGIQPVRRRCCRKQENLVWEQVKRDLGFNRCGICQSRHFELTVDPGKIGIRGNSL